MNVNEFMKFWYSDALFIQSDALKENSRFYDYDLLLSASVLEQKKLVVKYLKYEQLLEFPENSRKNIISNYSPKIIFIGVNLDTVYHAVNLCKEIKSVLKAPLVAISPGIDNKILTDNFDYVITGANEYSALYLYNVLVLGQGNINDIAGLIYLQDGKIMENQVKTVIPEEIPELNILLSQPYCSTGYYSSRAYDNCIKYLPADRVVNEIKDIVEKYFIKHLIIADKNFMSDYGRLNSICDLLAHCSLDFKISCIGDLDILYKYPDIVKKLVKAKISVIFMDISEKQFKKAKKVIENVAYQKNICISSQIFIGDPQKTIDYFEKIFNFYKEMTVLGKGFFFALPAYFRPEKLSEYATCLENDFFTTEYGIANSFFKSKNFSKEQLYDLTNRFTKEILKLNDAVFKTVSFDTLCFYHNLSENYAISTIAQRVLNIDIIKQYFSFFSFASFNRIENISLKEIEKWLPLRVLIDTQYVTLEDGYKLPGHRGNMFVKKKLEVAVYEYSFAKLNIGDIAKKIIADYKLDMSVSDFIRKIMIPFYKKLEKNYQIIFYR